MRVVLRGVLNSFPLFLGRRGRDDIYENPLFVEIGVVDVKKLWTFCEF